VLDAGFIAYDAYNLAKNPTWQNAAWLGASVLMAVIPLATELRAAAKGIEAGAKALEAGAQVSRAVNAAEKVGEAGAHAVEASAKAAESGSKLAESGAKAAETAGAAKGVNAAAESGTLGERAKEIHGALGERTQRSTTTAVGTVRDSAGTSKLLSAPARTRCGQRSMRL
jgi:hypothetical protein